jgi:hypothetical protein
VKGWGLYKGSEWLACNGRAANTLLATDPDVTAWSKQCHIPDESYLQTVVRRSSDVTLDNRDVTWVPPKPVEPTPGWMLLKQENLDPVIASGVAFARKMDQARNPDVIAEIDAGIDAIRNGGAVALVEDTRDRSSTQP